MGKLKLSELLARFIYRMRLLVRPRPCLRKIGWQLAGARFGARTIVPHMKMTWPHQVRIGDRCVLEDDLFFKYDGVWEPGPSIVIGDDTFLGRGCEFNIRRGLWIGSHCLIASGCKFVDANHGTMQPNLLINRQPPVENPIILEDNVWLGSNVIVLKGVTIGTGAVVAAGAVVTKSVAPYAIVAGVPARKIGERRLTPSSPAWTAPSGPLEVT